MRQIRTGCRGDCSWCSSIKRNDLFPKSRPRIRERYYYTTSLNLTQFSPCGCSKRLRSLSQASTMDNSHVEVVVITSSGHRKRIAESPKPLKIPPIGSSPITGIGLVQADKTLLRIHPSNSMLLACVFEPSSLKPRASSYIQA